MSQASHVWVDGCADGSLAEDASFSAGAGGHREDLSVPARVVEAGLRMGAWVSVERHAMLPHLAHRVVADKDLEGQGAARFVVGPIPRRRYEICGWDNIREAVISSPPTAAGVLTGLVVVERSGLGRRRRRAGRHVGARHGAVNNGDDAPVLGGELRDTAECTCEATWM